MEKLQGNSTFREIVALHYSEVLKTMSPDKIAEWVQNLTKMKAVYPRLWDSSLNEIEQLAELWPEESRMILHLLPSLSMSIAEYVNERSEEEMETEGREIATAALQALYQLFLIAYMAGYTDGQRNP